MPRSNRRSSTWRSDSGYRTYIITAKWMISDETILRSARLALDRSAGGLPTGPLSLVLDTARASGYAGDRDGTEALIEDVVRQTANAFPDSRRGL
jgi:hypothetical protein